MRTWKGLVNKSKTQGNDMFTAKSSQPVNLPEFQTKSYIKGKETNKTKQNKTNKKYNVLLEIERNRCYVSLPW